MYNVNESMNRLVSIYRHDFLNILQVVGGLAQLNKTDRLMTYIRKASEEVQQMGRLIGCGDPRFALFLYEQLVQDFPGNCLLHVSGTIPLMADETLEQVNILLHTIHLELVSMEDYTLSLSIQGKEPALRINIFAEADMEPFWLRTLNVADNCGLCATVDRKKAEITLLLDNPLTVREK